MTLNDLVAALCRDDDLVGATITDDTSYVARNHGNGTDVTVSVTHRVKVLLDAGGGLIVSPGTVYVDPTGVVTGVNLDTNAPWWAVEVMKRATVGL